MLRRSQNDCITRLFGDKHVSRSRQPAGHLLRTSSFILLEYMSKGVDGKTWSCYAPSTTALSVQSEQAALLRRVITGHERLDHFCTRLISQKYDAQRERTVQSVCVGGSHTSDGGKPGGGHNRDEKEQPARGRVCVN